jgi:hypothetical protein
MNTVKKFETFEQLKSCENKAVNYAMSLRKHNKFNKVIMNIRAIKKLQDNQSNPNQ